MLVSELAQVKGSDFEAVEVSSLMVDPDSGLAIQSAGAGGSSNNSSGSAGGSAGSSSGGGGGGGCFISILLGGRGRIIIPKKLDERHAEFYLPSPFEIQIIRYPEPS